MQHALPIRNAPLATAVRRTGGLAGSDFDVYVAVTRTHELTRVADRRDLREVQLGVVGTLRVIHQLVERIDEGACARRSLVQFDENIASHAEQRLTDGAESHGHLDVVLPFDFEADVGRKEIRDFVGVAKRNVAHGGVEVRSGGVPSVLVAERAPGRGIFGGMPRGIQLAVGAHGGVLIVNLNGTRVEETRCPRGESAARTGRCVVDIDYRRIAATGSDPACQDKRYSFR